MNVTTEIHVWREWLRNYQAYQGRFSVPKAYELERVLGHAAARILEQQTEIEILEQKVRRLERDDTAAGV